jgi:lysophospholipid hydrolase
MHGREYSWHCATFAGLTSPKDSIKPALLSSGHACQRACLPSRRAAAGLAPPVYEQGDLLVDGGYLNNIPVDVMRSLGFGTGAPFCAAGQVPHGGAACRRRALMIDCSVAERGTRYPPPPPPHHVLCAVIVVDVEDRDQCAWHNLTPYDGGLSGWQLLWDRWCPISAWRWVLNLNTPKGTPSGLGINRGPWVSTGVNGFS